MQNLNRGGAWSYNNSYTCSNKVILNHFVYRLQKREEKIKNYPDYKKLTRVPNSTQEKFELENRSPYPSSRPHPVLRNPNTGKNRKNRFLAMKL